MKQPIHHLWINPKGWAGCGFNVQEKKMKKQRGFIVFMGAAWLAIAAAVGVGAAVVNDEVKNTTAAAPAAATLAQAEAASGYVGTSYSEAPYEGTLYRNEGHFGDKNSDRTLESVSY